MGPAELPASIVHSILLPACPVAPGGRFFCPERLPIRKKQTAGRGLAVCIQTYFLPRRELFFSSFRSESLLSDACMNCFRRASKSAGPGA